MPIEAIRPEAAPQAGLDKFFAQAMEALESRENTLRGGFVDALGGANPYRDVPAHLKAMISNLEASAATPEEIRQVERLRDGVERHFEANGDFFEAKIQSKTKSRQLEIAFTGVNSTIKGFQQLLSAT